MTALIIATFPAAATASRAVAQLGGFQAAQLAVDDAAIVAWDADAPRPVAWQVRSLAAGAELDGAFWGLLFAHLFLLPRTLPADTSIVGDSSLTHLGLGPDHLDLVRDRVQPGTSTLIVVHATHHTAALIALLDRPGITVSTLHLTPEESRRLSTGFREEAQPTSTPPQPATA
jgi:uncharacterized membrane protein